MKKECEYKKENCIHKGTKVCNSCVQEEPSNYAEEGEE